MKPAKPILLWKGYCTIIVASVLLVGQYILAFFVLKLPGWQPLQWVGWGIWVISCIFGIGPILIFRRKGGVSKGKSYTETTRLVDTSLYAIVRHPQYLAGILFNLALMLMAQHWLVIVLGLISMLLIYRDMGVADQEAISKFGPAYRVYMQRVPRANILLGIYRLIQAKPAGIRDSRMAQTQQNRHLAASEWNDSLTGDFLWTNSNFCEAVCDVMTPASRSMWEIYMEAVPFHTPGYSLVGVIGGRPYINLSLLISVGRVFGMGTERMLQRMEDLWGRVPEGVEIPLLPLTNWQMLHRMLPVLVRTRYALRVSRQELRAFTDTCRDWCIGMRTQIQKVSTPAELANLWLDEIRPYFGYAWRIGRAALESDRIGRLRRELIELVGTADANALLSNLSGSAQLASLGPLAGLAKVACNQMSRQEYLRRYGHRGPHELELSFPRPAEDSVWLDQQLAMFVNSPVDVDRLLEKQRVEFEAAWERFLRHKPRQAKSIRQRIERVAESTRWREAARSEATRLIWVVREFVLRVGEFAGFENREDVFFLSLDEMLGILSGNKAALAFIPARREMHARYSALPPYPAIIIGRFDPFKWAADPNRRSDLFDARPTAIPPSAMITGFAGSTGVVEGLVRRINSPEEGDKLLPGEILVTATTNVGWTPLFPRATAVVTDVGAPLSHAAIVARELGIPAVVGCGNATMHLHTGDRVRVNGGQGIVEILMESGDGPDT
jgi:protein-S-isoprenylcysteine O-methyltransferase Ste14/phosphohistidine swiveling domain-containing protein